MTDSSYPDLLFVPYRDTLDLLTPADAMRICEDVYRMHARDTVHFSKPPSFKLDTAAPFFNHWHVKGVLMEDPPVTGVRLYNHYDDGQRNTVGYLECARYVMLTDPHKGHALAIVDEHWSYALRSTAAAIVPVKWMGPKNPDVLGLVGIGTMGVNALRCLLTIYPTFKEIRITSRRQETRDSFAAEWSKTLGIPVIAKPDIESVVRGADIIVGGTTSNEINAHAEWLKPGSTFISLARRELDPADWARMDKVVIDDYDLNYLQPQFRKMIDTGLFSREQLHGTIAEVVTGQKPGRERDDERLLIHTTGLVSQDVALAHFIYEQAKAKGLGITLPAAR